MASWLHEENDARPALARSPVPSAHSKDHTSVKSGKLVIMIMGVKALKGGRELGNNAQATVGLTTEDGKEYATTISPSDPATFNYTSGKAEGGRASVEVQLYDGNTEVPHRFKRKAGAKGGGDRLLGEAAVDLYQEWPTRSLFDTHEAQQQTVQVMRGSECVCTLDVSLQFVPDTKSASIGSQAHGAGECDNSAIKGSTSWTRVHSHSSDSQRSSKKKADGSPGWLTVSSGERGSVDRGMDWMEKGSGNHEDRCLTSAEKRVFRRYDRDGKGHLSPSDFKAFLADVRATGVNMHMLSNGGAGCCGRLVALPGEPLCAYISHNHSVFSVCYGYGEDTSYQAHLGDRVFLMVIVFLYSVCLTCAIVQYMPNTSYVYRLIGQSIIDVLGLFVIYFLFYVSHLKSCPVPGRLVGDLLLTCVFLVCCIILYLKAEKVEQVPMILQTFMPNWLAGRFTELFQVAAIWAFKVQYGSVKGAF